MAIVASALRSWLTYDPAPVSGLAQSPAGNAAHRRLATIAAILIAMMTMLRWNAPDHSTTSVKKGQLLPAAIAHHVAGSQPRQDESGGRGHRHQQQREDQPAEEEAPHRRRLV